MYFGEFYLFGELHLFISSTARFLCNTKSRGHLYISSPFCRIMRTGNLKKKKLVNLSENPIRKMGMGVSCSIHYYDCHESFWVRGNKHIFLAIHKAFLEILNGGKERLGRLQEGGRIWHPLVLNIPLGCGGQLVSSWMHVPSAWRLNL